MACIQTGNVELRDYTALSCEKKPPYIFIAEYLFDHTKEIYLSLSTMLL